MAGLNIGIDLFRNKREKEARQREVLQYLPMLADRGYNPDEVNSIMNQYIEGGNVSLPTQRSKISPDDPTKIINEPIEFSQKQTPEEAYYDTLTNKLLTAESLGLKKGTKLKTFSSKPKDEVDIVNFDEERGTSKTVGTTRKGSKVITTRKKTSGGSGPTFTMPGTKPQESKQLTKELAAQFLKQANGDKNMARKLAKDAGYTF